MYLSASDKMFMHMLSGKLPMQACSMCAIVCSHFLTKDSDHNCSVVLEDRYIITQEGELQEMLFIMLRSV